MRYTFEIIFLKIYKLKYYFETNTLIFFSSLYPNKKFLNIDRYHQRYRAPVSTAIALKNIDSTVNGNQC